MSTTPDRRTLRCGLWLLLVSLPLGLTLEALHAMKVPVYLGSAVRREMWTLAHAHGNLLGILCVVVALAAEHICASSAARARMLWTLRTGAVLMPVGFFLGGVLNFEGDPSYGIVLVPIGGVFLLGALIVAVGGRGTANGPG